MDVCFNELYVVERLLDCVAKINYPSNLLDVQVLDDSTDETSLIIKAKVKELQQPELWTLKNHAARR